MNHIVAKSYNPFVPNSYLNKSIIFMKENKMHYPSISI